MGVGVGTGWLACSTASGHMWIHWSQAKFVMDGETGPHSSGYIECIPMDHDVSQSVRCEKCRWFDNQKKVIDESGDLVMAGHVDFNVLAKNCLEGTFPDAADAYAWARRNSLVHKRRYAAECILPREDRGWLLVWRASLALCVFLCCICCAYIRRGQLLRRHEGAHAFERGGDVHSKPRPHRVESQEVPVFEQSWKPGQPSKIKKLAAPSGAPASAVRAIQEIHEDLLDKMDAPLADRKNVMRKYLMQWHPDKNSVEDQEVATAVIQFLNEKKDWFLSTTVFAETATLLP